MDNPRISVIGLGKLGAPMLAAFASKGFEVTGVDANREFVEKIKNGISPVSEPLLQEYLTANKERISATLSFENAIRNSDITFIIVPTPSESSGGFSTHYVVDAAKNIAEALRKKSAFHVVALTSTVLPGATEGDLLPVLEKYSGKKCGIDFGLAYNPEFIALGSVIRNLLNPDFILIGESDSRTGETLESFYKGLCGEKTAIKRMNIVNAEVTKIALNTYVTTKISYANMLAELCEKIPGGNVDIVTDALGCDSRIGHKYLKGALGYGGPCFPRDNRALVYAGKKLGVSLPIAEATDAINTRKVERIAELVVSKVKDAQTIGILGLSYKPDTHVVEESQGLEIARRCAAKGFRVSVYDPAAMEGAKEILSAGRIRSADSMEHCIRTNDVIVIATPWPEFKNISPEFFRGGRKKTILDCWKMLDKAKFSAHTNYFAVGIHHPDMHTGSRVF